MNTDHNVSKSALMACSVSLLLGASVVTPVRAETVSVTVDLSQRSEPISKYIYGQFIELLGRCIYGGLWPRCWKTGNPITR